MSSNWGNALKEKTADAVPWWLMDSENGFMLLTWFAQLTYVNVLHWIVRLYYHNKDIGLILVIMEFYPSSVSVLNIKDVCPNSSIKWPTIIVINFKTILKMF